MQCQKVDRSNGNVAVSMIASASFSWFIWFVVLQYWLADNGLDGARDSMVVLIKSQKKKEASQAASNLYCESNNFLYIFKRKSDIFDFA